MGDNIRLSLVNDTLSLNDAQHKKLPFIFRIIDAHVM